MAITESIDALMVTCASIGNLTKYYWRFELSSVTNHERANIGMTLLACLSNSCYPDNALELITEKGEEKAEEEPHRIYIPLPLVMNSFSQKNRFWERLDYRDLNLELIVFRLTH